MNINKSINKNYNIHERIFNFIVSVLKFVGKLPRTITILNQTIIKQTVCSVTSIGANGQEADGAG